MKSNYTTAHQKMMRHVFLQTELLLNDDINEISEYDIQSLIYTFFSLRQEKYQITEVLRERDGKVDIVVKLKDKSKIYVEIKTYFKNGEDFIKTDFDHDFAKLLKKSIMDNSKAYFIIAGIKGKFNTEKMQGYDFIIGKYLKSRKDTVYTLNIDGVIQNVRIRPSIGQRNGKSHLWSWRVVGKV
jgi:hypothetical protein